MTGPPCALCGLTSISNWLPGSEASSVPRSRGVNIRQRRNCLQNRRLVLGRSIDVSIIISTYNRCRILPDAIKSALQQTAKDTDYEVLVVDNNSTDGTREVVESFISDHPELRYIFAGNQGVANARNAGISQARGRILGFMDDDVRASPNWLAEIKLAFDKHPEAGFVGGKILPVWPVPPPAWLTSDHWSPLAILDYGDSEICLVPENTIGVVSANLAIRREVFQQVGLFSPQFQLVGDGIGALEDHELIVRIWRSGGRGIYLPQAIVTTDVPLERMTKRYHRRWQRGNGHFYALLREPEMERSAAHLFGVPSHVYKEALLDIALSVK